MACVTALEDAGLFAATQQQSHLHLDHTMSRLRSPQSRFIRLDQWNRTRAELHWSPLFDDDRSTEYSVSIQDALAQVLRCQDDWLALASIDNALHKGAIADGDLGAIFASVPERYQDLRGEVDGRAEAGQETVLRMIAKSAGLRCEPQVTIARVGRVDLLVEGCLVLEADSRLAHDGWERHVEDRRRDLQLGALGYMSLRPAYQHTMHHPHLVRSAIMGLLAQRETFGSSAR
jgi:very-short-patch-repair endonuclease